MKDRDARAAPTAACCSKRCCNRKREPLLWVSNSASNLCFVLLLAAQSGIITL